jgi:hypothetical protein
MEAELARHGSRTSNANAVLANMGYKRELPRSLSMMSTLGLYVSTGLEIRRYPNAEQFLCHHGRSIWRVSESPQVIRNTQY